MRIIVPDRDDPDAYELPTRHLVDAALHVASLLDPRGSPLADAHESYWLHATGGTVPPADLERGERLLVASGLVDERQRILYPKPELIDLLRGTNDDAVSLIAFRVLARSATPFGVSDPDLLELVPDSVRREELLALLRRRFDDVRRREIGAIGEELVVASVRDVLCQLGRPDLAREVRHVSLESDQLGYDISAPRVSGPRRLLEVKATTNLESDNEVVVHVTRGETEVGVTYPEQWALVICRVTDVSGRRGGIRGWCGAQAFVPLLPTDGHTGRWETASIELRSELLEPGLPRPVM
jgi:hypothetical protein